MQSSQVTVLRCEHSSQSISMVPPPPFPLVFSRIASMVIIMVRGCDSQPPKEPPRRLDERTFVRFTREMGRSNAAGSLPRQASLDDLGLPLADVPFCVVDLETTGTSIDRCAITEVGAVRLRGGTCEGTFQTLVDPGCAIPPAITVLTGITESLVVDAPRIEAVLPSLLEFLGDAVVVGHNVRFDLGFLNAAMRADDRPVLSNRSIDTCALSRRLLRDEVPNHKLGTLANHLRLDHQPSHRALDDALATGDLLHHLLERAGSLGVTGLEDLLVLPKLAGHAQVAKLRLTEDLPRRPGVYLFRSRRGEVLYVGKATDLRARVRSYFSADKRRKIHQLLRETERIDHRECHDPLEAAVTEIRLIHEHEPRFNRRGTTWRQYAYVKLSLGERFPRLSAARVVRDDGALYVGPVASVSTARRIIEAVETVVPLRRCTGRPGRTSRTGACVPAQLGVATCPCTGDVSEGDYAVLVEHARRGLTSDPASLLRPLADRMARLADEERFEEATETRDRAAALADAVRRHRRLTELRSSGRLVVNHASRTIAEFHHGALVAVRSREDVNTGPALPFSVGPTLGGITGKEEADELHCVTSWLHTEADRLVVEHCDGFLAEPVDRPPTFTTGRSTRQR